MMSGKWTQAHVNVWMKFIVQEEYACMRQEDRQTSRVTEEKEEEDLASKPTVCFVPLFVYKLRSLPLLSPKSIL